MVGTACCAHNVLRLLRPPPLKCVVDALGRMLLVAACGSQVPVPQRRRWGQGFAGCQASEGLGGAAGLQRQGDQAQRQGDQGQGEGIQGQLAGSGEAVES